MVYQGNIQLLISANILYQVVHRLRVAAPQTEQLRFLKTLPFGELQRLASDGSSVPPAAHAGTEGRLRISAALRAVRKAAAEVRHARANKNRPVEVSSKVAVPRLRQVVPEPKRTVRDPRFESLSGAACPPAAHALAPLYTAVLWPHPMCSTASVQRRRCGAAPSCVAKGGLVGTRRR